MACLNDNCIEIDGVFPECFTGTASWYFDDTNTAVVLKIEKGSGAFLSYEGTTNAITGELTTVFPTDLDPDFFTQEGGWYTVRGYDVATMNPAEMNDSNGHGHSHECIRFCVGPPTTSATWTYAIPPHPGGH